MLKRSRRDTVVGAALVGATSAFRTRGRGRDAGARSKFRIDEFVSDVKRARTESDAQRAVHAVVERAVADPRSVVLGIGEPTSPGIHEVYRTPILTILNVIWAPLMILLPHEHLMWATIGIYSGREDNILWNRSGPRVDAHGAASLSEGDVFSLGEDAVHSVANPIERMTGALHIYGGDFFDTPRKEWDAGTLLEQPFDLEHARKAFADASRRFEAGR
jgi:predicted metal-dependent enzyme (double-stranded beta helix superfamily)